MICSSQLDIGAVALNLACLYHSDHVKIRYKIWWYWCITGSMRVQYVARVAYAN